MNKKAMVLLGGLGVACIAVSEPYKDGDTVVFLGDSITHGGYYHSYITDFYRTRYPDATIRFVNSGIGGDNAKDAFRRVSEDVEAYAPTHVAIHFGMNDIGRDLYRIETSARMLMDRENCQMRYRKNMAALTAEVRRVAPQARLMYLTPTHYDDTAVITNAPLNWSGWQSVNQVGCNVGLSLMAGYVLVAAGRDGADSLDWFSLMNNFIAKHRCSDKSFMTTGIDRVHPGPLGHSLMAWEFLKHQGVSPVVSEVTVDAESVRVTSAINATADAVVSCGSGGVAFDLLAKAIPFPVPEEALAYIDEFDVEKHLNRETITIVGLLKGRYAMMIDGECVGEYSDEEFAKGVGLGFNSKTPQYRQAQVVFKRVEELRQEECVLRNHHSARWFYAKRAPVDDVRAFASWFEKSETDRNGYFQKFVPGYLEYWPRRVEVRARLWNAQQAVRLVARPIKRHYEIKLKSKSETF